MSCRKHPLHTCAVSFFAIASKTSRKARDLDGPIGTLLKRSAIFASPLFYAVQYLILATLVFVDSYILACEDNLVSLYPPSNRVFDKVDELVRIAEALPGKFDAFWDDYVVAWLDFLVSGPAKNEERDVKIDENFMKSNEDSAVEETNQMGNETGEAVEIESCSEAETTETMDGSDKEEGTVGSKETGNVTGPLLGGGEEDKGKLGISDEKEGNATQKGENGVVVAESNVKPSLAEEWFESGWAVKPKPAAPKKKPKGKKKKN